MAKAKVTITGDSKDAQRAIDGLDKKSNKLKDSFKKAAKVAATGLVAGITLATAAAVKGTKETLQYADTIDKTSQRIGLSKEATQEWKYVAEQMGTEIGSLERGLTRFQKRIGEADDGLSSAQRAFENLNIEWEDGQGNLRAMDNIFPETVKKLSEMEDETKRNQLAMELFGRGGKELIPILNQNSGDIEKLTEKAHDLGFVMSDDTVNAGVKLKDTFHSIKSSMGGLVRDVIADFLPTFQTAASWIETNMPIISEIVSGAIGIVLGLLKTLGQLWIDYFKASKQTTELTITAWKGLAIGVQLSFELIKKAVLEGVNFVLSKLSILEKLPFGVGDKFKGMKDSISDSAEVSGQKIEELTKQADENRKEIIKNAKDVGEGYKNLGTNLAGNVKGIIDTTKEMVAGTKKALVEQTEITETEEGKQVTAVEDGEEDKTEAVKNESQNRIDLTQDEYDNRREIIESHYDDLNDMMSKKEAGVDTFSMSGSNFPKITEAMADVHRKSRAIIKLMVKDTFMASREMADNITYAYKMSMDNFPKITAEVGNQRRQIIEQNNAALMAAYNRDAENYTSVENQKVKITAENNQDRQEKQESLYAQFMANRNKLSDDMAGMAETDKTVFSNMVDSMKEKLSSFSNATSMIVSSITGLFNAEMNKREVILDNWYAKEKQKIEDSKMSEKEKQKALMALEDKRDKKKKELALKQAKRQKQTSLMEAVVNTASAIVEALPNMGLAAVVGAMGAAQIAAIESTPLPELAEGGILQSAGGVLVGERGPEILDLPRGARVTPLNKTNNSNIVINNTFNNPRITSREEARKLMNEITGELKRAGVVMG